MINRFRTRCTTCGHCNTLRITLGTEQRQEHTFACAGCGLPTKVALDLDFRNPVSVGGNLPSNIPEELKGMFSQPRAVFHTLENCILCEDEGTITNLDPTFLVPSDLLHKDGVFSWMLEARRIGLVDQSETLPKPKINDIIHGIGGIRELKSAITTLVKAWSVHRTGRFDIRDKIIAEFCLQAGVSEELTINSFAVLCASLFLGRTRETEIHNMMSEVIHCSGVNPAEYQKLRARLLINLDDLLTRQIGMLEEYSRAYDQLSQTLIYAIRDKAIGGKVVASSKDLRAVRMFYGNCFENLASGFDLPACINNINMGRPYDQFEAMTLVQYLTINKAKRANPFTKNKNFTILHDEFDSTIRNASHHAALRVCTTNSEFIEYRSGDTGNWKKIPFTEYLLRCNKIMMCAMRLLLLQIFIAEDFAGVAASYYP